MSSKKRSASASMSKKSSVSPTVVSARRLLRETLKHQPQQNINSNCEIQMPNRNTAEESSKPYVRIVEQPADKWFKFRYSSDSQTSSMLLGENWSPSRETYPAIEILNYKGRAVVIISCVTEDAPYKPHPHTILSDEGYIHGICILQIPHRAEFQSLGIKSTKRNDVDMALKKRESIGVDPFKTGFSHRSSTHCIDLNVVRLCFQVFIADGNGHLTVPLKPVVTKPIYDKRSLFGLAIHEICSSGSVLGNTEIILLCNKLVKEDVSVRFYEEQNGVTTWEDFGSFGTYDVYKQSSIRLRTPRYHNINITKPVTVLVQLIRASDNIASEPVRFTYKPVDPESNLMLLRRKCERIGLNPQMNIPLKLRNAPGGVSFPLFNFNNAQFTPPPEVVPPSNNSNQSNTSSSSAPSSPSSSSSTLYLPSPSPSPSLHTTSSVPAFIAARGGGYLPETEQVSVAASKPNESGMYGACQQIQQQQQQLQLKPQCLALQEIQQSIPPLDMPNEQLDCLKMQPQPQRQKILQYLSLQESQQATPPQNMPIVQQHYQQPRKHPKLQHQPQIMQQYSALSKTQQSTPPQNRPIVQQHYQQLRPQPQLQKRKLHEKSQYFALREAQHLTSPQNVLNEQQHHRKPQPQLQQQQSQEKIPNFALSETQQAIPRQNMPIVQQHYQQPRPQPQFQLQQHQTRLQYLEVAETQKATPPQNMLIEQQNYQRPKPQPQLQQQQQQARLQYLALQETQQATPPQNMSIVQQHYQQQQPQNETQPNVSDSTNKTSWEQQFANVVLFAASALSNLNGNSTEANMQNFMAATAPDIIQHEQQQQQPQHYEHHLSPTQQQQYQRLKTEPQWESQSQMSLQQQLINNEMIIKTDADVGSSDFDGVDDEDQTITTLLNIDNNEIIQESRVEQAILQLTNDELELSESINKTGNFVLF